MKVMCMHTRSGPQPVILLRMNNITYKVARTACMQVMMDEVRAICDAAILTTVHLNLLEYVLIGKLQWLQASTAGGINAAQRTRTACNRERQSQKHNTYDELSLSKQITTHQQSNTGNCHFLLCAATA